MGASKTFVFNVRQNRISIIMKALGHPARVAIIDYLGKYKHACSDDIVFALPLSQPTISHHLKELRKARLINGTFKGSRIYYHIDRDVFSKIEKYHNEMLKKIE